MARKSRKNVVTTAKIPDSLYKVAIYARLSNESEANMERKTIDAQIQLIRNYVESDPELEIVEEYTDLSYSGTNFQRPAFERMIGDAKAGRINCIITKDLSRLGRNYIDTAEYIERIFPFLGVRYIAVTDGFDSNRDGIDMIVQLKNVINEQYARDISRKIKSSMKANWESGKYICGIAPYGYKKVDKHLEIDKNTSPIVQRIFQMYMDYGNMADIYNTLNKEKIDSPAVYRYKCGLSKKEPKTGWTGKHITQILTNQVYVGDTVHGKDVVSFHEGIERHMVQEKDWIIIPDTHEEIIRRDIFETVQSRIKEHRSAFMEKRNVGKVTGKNLLKGKVICGDCKKSMQLKQRYKDVYKFVCSTSQKYGVGMCDPHTIEMNLLYDKVFTVIKSHIKHCMSQVQVLQMLNNRQDGIDMYQMYTSEIRKTQQELQRIVSKKASLFADYKDLLINEEEYLFLSEKYTNMIVQLKSTLEELHLHQAKFAKDFKIDEDWQQAIDTYIGKRRLTQEMVDAFVEQVIVYSADHIQVKLYFDDMLIELNTLLEERTNLWETTKAV